MHKHTINFLARGDKMDMKNMAYMMAGAAMMMVYQKYKKPIGKAMKDAINKEAKMMDDMLEDMM